MTVERAIDNIAMVGGRKALTGIHQLAKARNVDLVCSHHGLNSGVDSLPIRSGE